MTQNDAFKNSRLAIEEIKEHCSNRRLIPFIGSGFSKCLKLPDWREMISSLGKDLGYEEDLFLLHGNYQQLAEYAKKKHHRSWDDFVHNILTHFHREESVQLRKKSRKYDLLTDMKVKTIYTTNYDRHIEEAFKEKNKKVKTVVKLEHFLEPNNAIENIEIVKFHGCVVYPDTMVITESQYFDRMRLEHPVDQRLRSDVLSNSFLFLGYSFSDPNIRYIWYKINHLLDSNIEGSLGPSYVIAFEYDDIQAELLKSWNIEVVYLDPVDKEGSIEEFLREINE